MIIIPNDNQDDNNVHILVLVLTLLTYLLAFCGAVIVGKLRVAKDKDLDLAFPPFFANHPITQSPILIICRRHHRHVSHQSTGITLFE